MIELSVVLAIVALIYLFYKFAIVQKIDKISLQRKSGVIVEKANEEYKLQLNKYTDYICGDCKDLVYSTHPHLNSKMGFKECKKYDCMIRKEGESITYVKCGLCFKECYGIEKIYLKQDIEKLNQILGKVK